MPVASSIWVFGPRNILLLAIDDVSEGELQGSKQKRTIDADNRTVAQETTRPIKDKRSAAPARRLAVRQGTA